MDILELFSQNKKVQSWHSGLTTLGRQLVMGLSGSSKALAIASAYLDDQKKIVVVTSTQNEVEKLASDLSSLLDEELVFQFFADDVAAAEFIFASMDKALSRIETLQFLRNPKSQGVLIVSLSSLRTLLPNPDVFTKSQIQLTVGEDYDSDTLTKQLMTIGYQKVSQVISPGEFSRRGDILDIYEITQELPYRLEFFGDDIDSIRQFHPETQKSFEQLEGIFINPASDLIFEASDFQRGIEQLEKALQTAQDNKKSYLEDVLAVSKNGFKHKDIRKFQSLFYEKEWSLLDYIPKGTPIFFDDFQKLVDKNARFDLEIANLLTEDLQQGKALSNLNYFADNYRELRHYKPATFFSNFHKGLGNIKFDQMHQLTQYAMQEFFNQFPLLIDEIKRYQKNQTTVIVQVESQYAYERLEKSFQDYQFRLPLVSANQIVSRESQIVIGAISSGFYFADDKLALITEHEIYHKKIKRRARRSNISNAERLKDYNELAVGDYVVHNVHGIGRFLGIETIQIQGIHRDYVTIQYQNSDRISLPIDQIGSLSKYVSADGKEPKINKLNDGRFQKTKQKVARQVEDIADDLLKLYAERSQQKGFSFSPDDDLQRAFDDDFAFVETEDQLRSIKEIKADMESMQPMDRLLVGDVGFGKTEVAMRAAFKAVNDHKQVVVLVPTTVLAQQHYENFKARFENYPVEVDVLSRFRSKKEQAETLERVRKGQIDIIIGTHRLLSKDVVFSDLGLIVIDEEQRFGVKHKETLKELKTKVDVLTLTATPIPRTLHMSMLGIRDLSVIETPPTNRYPVQTYVLENNPGLVREAIIREMDRGGQVFYVYNKVDTIDKKVAELQELVPEASIGFVHGQMSEIQLENTLIDFINGDYDVLVATTIIETGVDISNVNTLFIENADHMGLSTLYQLRGRVGRSNRIAYAYLMYRPDKVLTEVSEKRLEAIKGFTELGSGFKIAMRDLSIRGAGNILGASQSGFIDSVGFEMYSQLLEQAIASKQGKTTVRQKGNTEINLQIDAYLPDDYISDERQKIDIYKRIREIQSREDYLNLQDELMDRFGEYPDQVAYLLEIALLKHYMDNTFAELVERKNNQVIVRFEVTSLSYFLTQDYFEALSKTHLKAKISEHQGKIDIVFDVRHQKDYRILEELMLFGERLSEIKIRKKNSVFK
ncbi:TPA: transcription-repair coupling factor [Streptococcus pyogenes]|uniref:transcription-repair coupling factor n=6 Tax=Streptococcus pyogenes TaxID=1314 RepID=UPI00000D96FB|nr:transcription-repair coupling factor [Streptococcus pyogenes]HER4721118.1 transcription-repair coupling factor [Streptococcus pyogenes NGAS308]HER4769030.1 transcription-repair coupling factor [Streptococcus pyogenes NGAS209]AAL96841.1 putative transcription-repair coupling factor [Streptococcus pyogenes MGAS8232]ESA54652.1 transcription-repair coupling factor [Streptococcus pyogenes GA41394]MDA6092083.1 transcription-repair coupling factor [Streptococcus pyogenes]